MNNRNNNFSDVLNAIALLVGVQNLQENREQSEHNDIQAENQKQTEHLLKEINKQFKEQNELLNEILKILKEKL